MTLDERFGDAVAPNGQLVQDNFKRWFKDSAVVDAAGDPLVVYHGTLNAFTEFKLGHGEAQSHGFMFVEKDNVNAYLWGYIDQVKYQETERSGDMAVMPMFVSIQNPMRVDTTETGEWADAESENATIAEAKRRGHDGVVFTDDEHATVFYVAFKAEQIKSAIGNSGLYALNSRRMCDEVDITPHLAIAQAQKAQAWLHRQKINSKVEP